MKQEKSWCPTHGSWLNMIEGFFSKITRQMLKGIRVPSKEELADRIYKYFDYINEVPVVFRWKYKMNEISKLPTLVGLAPHCNPTKKYHGAAVFSQKNNMV